MSRLAPVLAAVAAIVAALASAHAEAGEDLPTVEIVAGARVELCGTVVLCPASAVFCDDPSVARAEATAKGVALRGLAPGTTLCAAQGANLARRPFRVVVAPSPKKR